MEYRIDFNYGRLFMYVEFVIMVGNSISALCIGGNDGGNDGFAQRNYVFNGPYLKLVRYCSVLEPGGAGQALDGGSPAPARQRQACQAAAAEAKLSGGCQERGQQWPGGLGGPHP